MSALASILDQSAALRTLSRAVELGRLSSAYLFEGPSGVGKEQTALALVQDLIASERTLDAKRIRGGNHPDVRLFRPRDDGHRNLPVEMIRNEVLPVAKFAPFEAEKAFLLFPDADISFPEVHPESGNALLKTLEETRPNVHFVLISARPERLLPTIRSRCQRVRFLPLAEETIEAILERQGVDETKRHTAARFAQGRADRALSFATRESDVADLLLRADTAIANVNPGALLDLAEEFGKSEERTFLLEGLQMFYRDVSCAASGVEDTFLIFDTIASRIRERANRMGANAASRAVTLIQEAMDHMDRNANPEIVLDALFFRLRGFS